MSDFLKKFSSAFDFTLLGLYKKKQLIYSEDGVYCSALKKGLDKFAYLNKKYNLLDKKGQCILPFHETMLIKTFAKPLSYIIEKLPDEYKSIMKDSSFYGISELITIGDDNTYYLLQEAFEILERREFFKSKDKKDIEFEYKGQKLYLEMISNGQKDYERIRSFLINPKNTYIFANRFLQTEEQEKFIKEFPEVFSLSYDKLPEGTKEVKICPHCGLVLKENRENQLHCVSKYCTQYSKGWLEFNSKKINDTVMSLNEIAAHNIYYPGQLERKIENILQKKNIEYSLWPNMDEWDFQINFKDGSQWLIDAKDIENPFWIKLDINKIDIDRYNAEKILYVVPNRKGKRYLEYICKDIKYKNKVHCIKVNQLEKELYNKLNNKVGEIS